MTCCHMLIQDHTQLQSGHVSSTHFTLVHFPVSESAREGQAISFIAFPDTPNCLSLVSYSAEQGRVAANDFDPVASCQNLFSHFHAARIRECSEGTLSRSAKRGVQLPSLLQLLIR